MRTIGEVYGPVIEITTEEDARAYLEELITERMQLFNETRDRAAYIVHLNLGYYSGYFSEETRQRIQKLFDVSHPVFGKF